MIDTLKIEKIINRQETDRKERWKKADAEHHLTGPEYAFIKKILQNIKDYKIQNEAENKVQLAFIHNISEYDLTKIINKMQERMDMFDGGLYKHNC
jgi:hypothetical protein